MSTRQTVDTERRIDETGLDGVVLKPTECDVRVAEKLSFDRVCIDYEGQAALPDAETLTDLTEEHSLRVTTPVRADGFDPLGDDSLLDTLPDDVGRMLVAGHGAYLSEDERHRAVAPRLGAAVESTTNPWVGTESVERLAMAAGGVQYELLSRRTERDIRGLRAAGFDGDIAVYAPTVPTDDEDEILDAVGEYAARRKPVRSALPENAETDSAATGRAREVLSKAVRDYALVGDTDEIAAEIASLKDAGANLVVGYPAGGVETFEN